MITKLKKRKQIILWRCIAITCFLIFLLSATHVILAENFNIIIGSVFIMIIGIGRLLLLSNMKRIDSPLISPYSTDSYWAYRASDDRLNSSIAGKGYPNGKQVNFPYY